MIRIRNRRDFLGGLMLLAGVGIVANDVSQDWEGHQEASAQAQAAGQVRINFADGTVAAEISGVEKPRTPAAPKTARPKAAGQQDLFGEG